MSFDLSLITKYRTNLMGFAALMIIICHFSVYVKSMPHFLRFIFGFGNLGVDVFLFLSGIGCYYSLCRCNNSCIFLKKRFIRVFIPYTLVSIIFLFLPCIMGGGNWVDSLYVFSTLSYWISHRGAWYIALLIPLYILTPTLFLGFSTLKNRILMLLIVIFSIQFLSHVTIKTEYVILNGIVDNVQWALSRCISFVLGIYIAPMVQKRKHIKHTKLFCFCCIMIYLVLRLFYKELFLGWVLVPFILIVLCLFLEYSAKKYILQFTGWLGKISLESYLINMYLCGMMTNILILLGLQHYIHSLYVEYLLIIVFGLVLSCVINNLSAKIKNSIL